MSSLGLTEREAADIGPIELKAPGSPAWCWQTVSALQSIWQTLDSDFVRYMRVWNEAEEHRVWEKIPYDAPYGSKEAMLAKLGMEDEAGARARVAVEYAIPARPLGKHGGTNKHAKEGLVRQAQKNDAHYLTARIARDHPEILERMQRGEFTSVAAAARAAGIYTDQPKRISVTPDKSRMAKSLLQFYGLAGCQELIEVLRQTVDAAEENAD